MPGCTTPAAPHAQALPRLSTRTRLTVVFLTCSVLAQGVFGTVFFLAPTSFAALFVPIIRSPCCCAIGWTCSVHSDLFAFVCFVSSESKAYFLYIEGRFLTQLSVVQHNSFPVVFLSQQPQQKGTGEEAIVFRGEFAESYAE